MNTPVAGELRSVRTLLARLECAFARQEAKLDKVLGMISSGNLFTPPHQSTPISLLQPRHHPTTNRDCYNGPPATVPRMLALEPPQVEDGNFAHDDINYQLDNETGKLSYW